MKSKRVLAFWLAILAAACYAINIPLSSLLLKHIAPTMMAAFLYLGAGLGIGLLSLFAGKQKKREKLQKSDLPCVLGMILLDIAAPILLMMGLSSGNAASASLLGNFEIVMTALIALLFFREKVSGVLWGAIILITVSCMLLGFEGADSLQFSAGSLLVLGACCCWGLENNCTRMISSRDTFEIVTIKGIFSGLGSLLIALFLHESFPALVWVLCALLLGFVAYGISIFAYVKVQNVLGAARTSAYYAVNPFIGALLSLILLHENPGRFFIPALLIMAAGTALTILDTLGSFHRHPQTHSHGPGRRSGHLHYHFFNSQES